MNSNLILISLIEIFSAITIGIFILSLTYKLVQWVGRKYYGIQEYNLSYSIFAGAIILAVGIMVEGIIDPLISSFRLMNKSDNSLLFSLKYFGIGAIYIGIAYTVAVAIGLISTFLYAKLTPIDEFEEMEIDLTVNKNNYDNYISKYISINDSKHNYQIVTEEIIKDFEEKN